MERMYDVAIIGAGLAGSSMACAMASMGWDTVLIDRHTFPRHKACGEFLSPESQGVLAALGLSAAVESLRPARMDKVRVSSGGVSLDIALPGTAFGVSRYALDDAVQRVSREKGAAVLAGATVVSLSPETRGYRIELRDKGARKTIEARAVIGAWGRNPGAGLAAVSGSAARRSYIGVKSHVAGIEPQPAVELYFFRGGYVGLAPIEGGRYNVAALATRQAFEHSGKTVRGMLQTAARLNGALYRRLAGGEPIPGTGTAVAPVVTSRDPVPWGDVPHIGDAALVVPPLCGDGMAVALRSAEICAQLADGYLRGRLSLDGWRDAYSRALLDQCSGLLRWGNALQRLSEMRGVLPLLLRFGRLAPGLACRIVQATRLR
jgi:flavin-dependent dehydrogenase